MPLCCGAPFEVLSPWAEPWHLGDMAKKTGPRINTRGPLVGQCNICGETAKLTEDHTPPKVCTRREPMELRPLYADSSKAGTKPRKFQQGVTYRTLCARCNNDLLGGKYDLALGEFASEVRALASSRLELPDQAWVKMRPQPVIRSVLGHLTAQGLDGYHPEAAVTEPLRDYILDSSRPLPDMLRIYYWFYPFRDQVLLKGAGRMELRGDGPTRTVVFSLMKFYPLAFFVTMGEGAQPRYPLLFNLDAYRDVPFEYEAQVGLLIRRLVPQRWPESPGTHGMVILNDRAAVAAAPSSVIHRP